MILESDQDRRADGGEPTTTTPPAAFRLRPGATWSTDTAVPGDDEVVCHGDFGSWTVVWQGSRPVGIIDWDCARPAPRLHDVAYAPEYVTPFRDDAECVRRPSRGTSPRPPGGLLTELDDRIGWSAAHRYLAE